MSTVLHILKLDPSAAGFSCATLAPTVCRPKKAPWAANTGADTGAVTGTGVCTPLFVWSGKIGRRVIGLVLCSSVLTAVRVEMGI